MVCFVCVHCLDGALIPKFAMTWLTLVSVALVSVGWVVPPMPLSLQFRSISVFSRIVAAMKDAARIETCPCVAGLQF